MTILCDLHFLGPQNGSKIKVMSSTGKELTSGIIIEAMITVISTEKK